MAQSDMSSVGYLAVADLLAQLPREQTALLRRIADSERGIADCSVKAEALERLIAHFPRTLCHDRNAGIVRFGKPALARLFRRAIDCTEPHGRGDLCTEAEPTSDDVVAEILAAQAKGDFSLALRGFHAGGGVFFMHFHGLDACLRVLQGFPEEMQQQENLLVFASAMYALKSGNVSRARHLVGVRFGPEANDVGAVLARTDIFPLDFALFRFLMAMYEDVPITDAMRANLFDLLGQVPLDDHLQRGSFYNAMLEVFVRKREFDAAMEIARRARHHYRQADAHLLGFYIDLYQAILCLMRGALNDCELHAREARESLDKVGFESKSDERILGLVAAIIRYEQGDPQSLVRFLNEEFDQFVYGEIWPTVAELAINYGGQAMSRHVAIAAARVYLDKWRIQEWRSNRFRLVITLREVAILQGGNRWQEAADLLTTVQSRINRTWVEGAVENLVRLVDPQEIALVLAWLRHLIWEIPSRPLLRNQLGELLKNDHLTERQRITVLIWTAYLARRNRDITAARSATVKALEAAARIGSVMPLAEEARLIDQLLGDKRIHRFALASGEARQIMRKVRGLEKPVSEGARRAGLTRQEMKVLFMVVEGGTNKHVARQLGLSEVTIKFHLSNIYRKTGCRRRAEVVEAAKNLGWVA